MSDDVVWHCSFMAKIATGIFCRNPYKATGIRNRSSCPLANSRYATICDHDGKLCHNVIYVVDVQISMAHGKLLNIFFHSVREKIVTVHRKKNQRDFRKMKKAELAAEIDKCVQSELLERLTKGCYGEIYNSSFNDFNTILNHKSDVREIEDEKEYELEYVEADDIEMEMDGMEDFEGLPNSEDGDIDEDDDLLHEAVAKKQKGSGSNSRSMVGKRSMKVIPELEHDEDTHHKQRTLV